MFSKIKKAIVLLRLVTPTFIIGTLVCRLEQSTIMLNVIVLNASRLLGISQHRINDFLLASWARVIPSRCRLALAFSFL
jgi:hypothetical protein